MGLGGISYERLVSLLLRIIEIQLDIEMRSNCSLGMVHIRLLML
jgi:hypothetical protein